jgi:hypothetical protein
VCFIRRSSGKCSQRNHTASSALEIATKLCDAEFARKAKAADFLSRTWEVFIEAGAGRGEDKVCISSLLPV